MSNKQQDMKSKIFPKVMAVAMLSASPVLWLACTDAWDDHYGVEESGMTNLPSLLSNIAADPELSNFCQVVEAVGMADMLNSPQQLTVWAPVNFTSVQADSVIAVYEADKADGRKDEDNRALTQFFQNHVALYSRSVSALTDDTVSMLNGKYMRLVGTDATSGELQGNPFYGKVDNNNGILYKAENIQTFFPNIREYIELQSSMDSLAAFFATYDEYELDEDASVEGDVVDGKTVYLDSVTNLTNELLMKYGYIQREDSTYILIAPTDEVWNAEYERYHRYFNYAPDDPNISNADSLADVQTKTDIICGRFFNMSKSSKYNYNPEDSLCNTQYINSQSHNPRQNVYYKPETGILAGLEKVECSNGYIYVDTKGVIEPQTTFFGRKDLDAYSARYYEIPTNNSNEETMTVSTNTYTKPKEQGRAVEPLPDADIDSDTDLEESLDTDTGTVADADDGEGKTYSYVLVTAKTPSAQTQLDYTIPSTFSNCYYNIYLVTVPGDLPLWFQVQQSVKNASGSFPTSATYFTNPHPVTEGSVDNSDVILQQSNNGRCYVASTEKVDTILLQSAVKYDYSSMSLDEGVVKLTIGSFGPSSSTYRDKIYTRELRLNEIIMIPYETEAEAIAAADDKDAFNDELLEANKEN